MNGTPPNGKIVAQSSGNWIAVSRDSRNHPVVGCGQPVAPADPKRGSWSRYEAWQDLCMEAAWQPTKAGSRGRQVLLNRGQIMAALPLLTVRWNWSVGAVRWFLKTLEEEGMVIKADDGKEAGKDPQQQAKRQANANSSRVLTICNYDRYQMRMDLEHLLNNRRNDRQLPTEASEAAIRQSAGSPTLAQNAQQQATQQATTSENVLPINDVGGCHPTPTTGATTATGNTTGKRQATQQATQQAIDLEKYIENNDVASDAVAPTTGNTTGNDRPQQQAQRHAYKEEQFKQEKKGREVKGEILPSAKIPSAPDLIDRQERQPTLLLEEIVPTVAPSQIVGVDEIAIALDAYNAAASRVGWPKAVKLTAQRKAHIKARLVDAGGLDGWVLAMARAEKSSFLCGANKQGWTASLDFMLQASSFMKIIEGTYDNKNPAIRGNNQHSPSVIDEDGSFVGI